MSTAQSDLLTTEPLVITPGTPHLVVSEVPMQGDWVEHNGDFGNVVSTGNLFGHYYDVDFIGDFPGGPSMRMRTRTIHRDELTKVEYR